MKLVNGLSGVSVERHVNFMGTGFVDEWADPERRESGAIADELLVIEPVVAVQRASVVSRFRSRSSVSRRRSISRR